jgi:hypothetical protein
MGDPGLGIVDPGGEMGDLGLRIGLPVSELADDRPGIGDPGLAMVVPLRKPTGHRREVQERRVARFPPRRARDARLRSAHGPRLAVHGGAGRDAALEAEAVEPDVAKRLLILQKTRTTIEAWKEERVSSEEAVNALRRVGVAGTDEPAREQTVDDSDGIQHKQG